MSENQRNIAIVFADISGSTRLYELFGNDTARARIARCLEDLAALAEAHHGRVVKTIGDEIMCVFDSADDAATAACAMHEKLNESVIEDTAAGPVSLGVRVGLHFGPALFDADDVFGDAVNVAARMAGLAKAGQTMTTRESLALMAPIMQASARLVDRAPIKGKAGAVDIYEILWEENDVTRMSTDIVSRAAEDRVLKVDFRGQTIILDAQHPQLLLGRSRSADLTVDESLASRHHVKLERRRGKFFLVDQSTNGTYIVKDGEESFVRREEIPLTGAGSISLGRPFGDGENVRKIGFTIETRADDTE